MIFYYHSCGFEGELHDKWSLKKFKQEMEIMPVAHPAVVYMLK